MENYSREHPQDRLARLTQKAFDEPKQGEGQPEPVEDLTEPTTELETAPEEGEQ